MEQLCIDSHDPQYWRDANIADATIDAAGPF